MDFRIQKEDFRGKTGDGRRKFRDKMMVSKPRWWLWNEKEVGRGDPGV